MASWTYDYMVAGPLVVSDERALESQLNTWGKQGWELIDVDVQSNFLVFQQSILPPGCLAIFMLALNWFLNAIGRGTGR